MLAGIRSALVVSISHPDTNSSPSSSPNTIAAMRALIRVEALLTTAPANRPSGWRYFIQNKGTLRIWRPARLPNSVDASHIAATLRYSSAKARQRSARFNASDMVRLLRLSAHDGPVMRRQQGAG